jgi:hypothetical protein
MANPNIVNVTSIYGETAVLSATTANANVVANPASSGSVYKINSVLASNIDTAIDRSVSVDIVRASNSYAIARNITIPITSTLVLLSKDSSLYLQEGDTIIVSASANAVVQLLCSYEVIA